MQIGDVLDIYEDSKTLLGRATVEKVTAHGTIISADVAWDDGDAHNRQLTLFNSEEHTISWPRWQPSTISKLPLLVRIAKKQGDLMRAPQCAAAAAPPEDAIPSGIFGAAIDSSRLDNSFLASGLAGKCHPIPPSVHPYPRPRACTPCIPVHDEPPGCWNPCEHGLPSEVLLLHRQLPRVPPTHTHHRDTVKACELNCTTPWWLVPAPCAPQCARCAPTPSCEHTHPPHPCRLLTH